MSPRTCNVNGCGRGGKIARGLCSMHYQRQRRCGWIERPNEAGRFSRFVDASGGPDACHPWTAARNTQGYGFFSVKQRTVKASRWLLGHLRGEPLRPGEHALHRCDNPPCVNPRHLYIGTPTQNMRDRVERGRDVNASKTHCAKGHPYDEINTSFRTNGRHRQCKACMAASCARRRARKAAEGRAA